MIKQEQITEVKTISKRYCDDCGKEAKYRRTCNCCGKDMCVDCVGHEENDGGDYSDYYCLKCWHLGEPYRDKIKELEEQIEQLNDEWISKCRS